MWPGPNLLEEAQEGAQIAVDKTQEGISKASSQLSMINKKEEQRRELTRLTRICRLG